MGDTHGDRKGRGTSPIASVGVTSQLPHPTTPEHTIPWVVGWGSGPAPAPAEPVNWSGGGVGWSEAPANKSVAGPLSLSQCPFRFG